MGKPGARLVGACRSCKTEATLEKAGLWYGAAHKGRQHISAVFDPYPPHVSNCLHYKDPFLKWTSAKIGDLTEAAFSHSAKFGF